MKKNNRKKKKEDIDIKGIADALTSIVQSGIITKQEISVKTVSVSIPAELRLGECIVGGIAHLFKKNPTFNEDFMTALHHISDKDLGDAIVNAHKPYGFGN